MLKQTRLGKHKARAFPAAFRRLRVETIVLMSSGEKPSQPPSGGCVLKLGCIPARPHRHGQPPSGGCVLKLSIVLPIPKRFSQPPSGGCVLKL